MASVNVTKYASLKKQAANIQKELKTVAKAAFKEMSADVFDANPTLAAFGWTQYTPYWNDGDTCVFDANRDYPIVVFTAPDGKTVKNDENNGTLLYLDDDGEELEKEDGGEATDEEFAKYGKQIEKLMKQVSKFLNTFSDEDFLTMFGDHVQVMVSRSGKVEVEEYEHE